MTIAYEELVPGRVLGTTEQSTDPSLVAGYREIVGLPADDTAAIPPLMLVSPLSIKALLWGATPDGALQSSERLRVHELAMPGDELKTEVAVADKFVKRDRRYVVLVVLDHWWETAAWWRGAQGPVGDDERELWRVEAVTAGRSSIIVELCFAWCEAAFLEHRLGDVQLLLAKPAYRPARLPRPASPAPALA